MLSKILSNYNELFYYINCLEIEDNILINKTNLNKYLIIEEEYYNALSILDELEMLFNLIQQNDFNVFTDENAKHFIELLKCQEIECINNFIELNKDKIENTIYKNYIRVIDNLKKEKKLSSDDDEFLKKYLCYNFEKEDFPFDSTIKNVMIGNKIVSKELFSEIIKNFIKKQMNIIKETMDPNNNIDLNINKVLINFNNEDDKDGRFFSELSSCEIQLKNKYIDEFYENNDYRMLVIIFHELRHMKQYISLLLLHETKYQETYYDMLKECIIHFYLRKENIDNSYYKNNYSLYKRETDARIHEYIDTIEYINSIGLNFDGKTLEMINKKIKQEKENYNNQTRKINGLSAFPSGETTLDELFEYYIKKYPETLKKYPQFQLEYIYINGSISKRNPEQLMANINYEKKPDESNLINTKIKK